MALAAVLLREVVSNARWFGVIFGLIGGTGTSLGLGTPILSESISSLTGLPRTFAMDAFVIVVWTAMFGTTVYLGMERGINEQGALLVETERGVRSFATGELRVRRDDTAD